MVIAIRTNISVPPSVGGLGKVNIKNNLENKDNHLRRLPNLELPNKGWAFVWA